jgi:mono/diheme cytochrome c family protein
MTPNWLRYAVLGAVAVMSACSTKVAERSDEQVIADASRGGDKLYRRYCGACHGLEAKGDGIVSSLMTPKPRDLTTLARDFGGEFPREAVMQAIDGRETLRAHGDSDMPVWGANLSGELGRDATDSDIQDWIGAITDYLASVQVPFEQ